MASSVTSILVIITWFLLQTQAVFAAAGDGAALERRMLREQWEQASPEERIRLRAYFREQMHALSAALPPPAQAGLAIPFGLPNPQASPLPPIEGGVGFGFGFEKRRLEDLPSMPSLPSMSFPAGPLWSGQQKARGE